MTERLAAWGVHLYTATGLGAAAAMAVCVVRGDAASFRAAFAWMLLACLIDATDGWLARRLRVKEILPQFDGRRLDDIVDFQTYTSLPLLLLWRAGLLPSGAEACLLLPLVASAYGFCQAEAKTDDGYFLGFPSYWNIVAFYLYAFRLPAWANLAIILALAALTFVPLRYLYTTQPGRLNAFSNALCAAWVLLLARILLDGGVGPLDGASARPWVLASFFYPVYYMAASWAVTAARPARSVPAAAGTS